MADAWMAFLNCGSLFGKGECDKRSPLDEDGIEAKIAALAATVRAACDDSAPALLGLAEVSQQALAERVGKAVSSRGYQCLWSDRPKSSETGIALLLDTSVCVTQGTDHLVVDYAGNRRSRWLAARLCFVGGNRGVFWLVVNHWKSRMGGQYATESDRMASAREIGDFFRKQALKDSDLMVLIGDFNAEPGERVMANQRTVGTNQFVAARERAVVRRDRNRLAYFYNPMWRLMGEPDAWDGSPPDDPSDAPLGTYCADWTTRIGWSVFDQLTVSKRALTSPLLALRETTVRVQPPVSGCSDHCAVAAQFRY